MSQTRWFAIAAVLAIGLPYPSARARADAAPNEPSAAVKYTRTAGKHVPRQTLDTRVKRAKQQAELERTRRVPMLDAERYAKERTATEQSVADAQIVKLRQLVAITEKDAAELPELLLRLADLHLEKKVYFRRQADALYEPIDAHERAGRKPKARALLAKQRAFEKQADDASSAAVEVYQTLVGDRAFAKYKRLDEAIYFHAFELGELGREADMQTAYLRLLREHPSSRYIPNALLTFADFYYGKDRITEALALYQKVVEGYPDSPVYAYALYKQAWCHLNPVGTAEPEYDRSLDKFVKTITATLEGRAGNERNAEQLRRDARRDLVRAFVHAGKPSRAWEFFRTVGDGPNKAEDMSAKMMELLAAAYFGEGKYVESSAIYKALLAETGDDARRCDWQAKIVVNALASDDPQIQWKEAEHLAVMGGDVPRSKHGDRPAKACRDAAVDTLAQLATVWHDEADKTRKPAMFALAERAYTAFALYFPDDKAGYELGYYHAELRWQTAELALQRGDAALARDEFKRSNELFRETLRRRPDGKHTREAAFAQMLALKNAFGYDETAAPTRSCTTNAAGECIPDGRRGSTRRGAADKHFPETELTVAEGQMLHAYEVYQHYVDDPADPELPKIVYHRLKLLMDHNRFSEAKPLAIELVSSRDGSIYAVWAAQMLVDALTIAWTDPANDGAETAAAGAELDRWGRKLQQSKLWQHEDAARLRERMPTLLAGIGWKRAMAEQQQGKDGDPHGYKNCANGFVDIWNEFDNHPEGDILLFNAARCFEAAFLVGRAIEMRKLLLTHYPESSKHEQTLEELGKGYQGIALFAEAASSFEGYASKYPRGRFAAEALGNAYLFRIGLGQQTEAAAALDRYEEIYRRSDLGGAARIFWSKHALLQDDDQRLAHAREYLAKYGSKGGLDRQAVAEATIGQILWRRACPQPLMFDSCITVTRARATT
ncbi:MAG: hypothetical protein IAG13_00250, partial [Deltaproteobacteria bacterium]|nr:hypothetical protein [Nannocystaceae bacterium]